MCACVCVPAHESKRILGGWLPGLTACKCRVLPQYGLRAELKLWKLNPEQDSVKLLGTRSVKVPFGTKLPM